MPKKNINSVYVYAAVNGETLFSLMQLLKTSSPKDAIKGACSLVVEYSDLILKGAYARSAIKLTEEYIGLCSSCGSIQSLLSGCECKACNKSGTITVRPIKEKPKEKTPEEEAEEAFKAAV